MLLLVQMECDFYKNFDFLLKEAEKIGIFKKTKTNKQIEYCGMQIKEPFVS